jgi:hypothetical protein
MKSLVIVAVALQLASAFPQVPSNIGQLQKLPDGNKPPATSPNTPKQLPDTRPAPLLSKEAGPAPCKILPGDPQWPTDAEWKSALPRAIKRGRQNKESTRPDWHLSARSVADVQRAVNFANKHDIRLSIIATGHDFLSRWAL